MFFTGAAFVKKNSFLVPRISVGEKLKNIKRKDNIIILKYNNIHTNNTYIRFTLILKKKVIAGFRQIFVNL